METAAVIYGLVSYESGYSLQTSLKLQLGSFHYARKAGSWTLSQLPHGHTDKGSAPSKDPDFTTVSFVL